MIKWIRKLPERIRFKIAHYLNDRHPEMCWAELVMWELGYKTFKATFTEGGCFSQSCRGKNPWDAYCLKCATTGRLYRDQPTTEEFLAKLKPQEVSHV